MPQPARIIITAATCSTFGTGRCWSAQNPYWDGHHPTKQAALKAARKTKKIRDARWAEARPTKTVKE